MNTVRVQSLKIVLFVLCMCCPVAWGWRSFKIIFTKFDFEANSSYVDAKIQLQNTSDTAINVVLNTYENLDDLYIAVTIGLEADDGTYTTLLNRSASFCKMLKQRNSEPILRILYDDLLRHGTFMKECPIRKGTYTLHEYRPDEEMLPSYLPETNFLATLRLSTAKDEQLFGGMLYGRIDKSKGFNNLKMFSLG